MASKASSAGPEPARLPPAVLVVEDDQDVAMTINDVVEERGYRAICVPNGRAALSVLAACKDDRPHRHRGTGLECPATVLVTPA